MSEDGSTPTEFPRFTLGFFAIHVLLPILIGGMIYVCWRVDHLFMFEWFDALGLTPLVQWFRQVAAPARPFVPGWILFSLPDGTWVYACVAFFGRLWRDGPRWAQVLWIGMGPALAIGGELGQIPGWVPGTYDWVDTLCYVIAGAAAFVFAWKPWHRAKTPTPDA
ncbi:MAG: hypothetical protein AB8H79_12650 [Myxococcota bacterium]